MTEKRNIGVYFKISEKEQEIIRQKMAILGTQNQSAYIRKMVIDGYAVHLDWKSLTEMLSLMRRTSANVNQIAQRCNATGHFYEADLLDLKNGYAGLVEQTKTVVNDIVKLKVF